MVQRERQELAAIMRSWGALCSNLVLTFFLSPSFSHAHFMGMILHQLLYCL